MVIKTNMLTINHFLKSNFTNNKDTKLWLNLSIDSLKKLVYSEYVYSENCNEKRYEFIHTLLMLLV